MIKNAIDYYNSILEKEDSAIIKDMAIEFLQKIKFHKLMYGNRPLSIYLRPKFMSKEQFNKIYGVCLTLRNAVVKIKEIMSSVPGFVEKFGLTDKERMLAEPDPGYDRLAIAARWDSFWTDTSLNFVELNADSPAGFAYCDVMAGVYLDMHVMEEFEKKYKIYSFSTRPIVLRSLLDTYREWKGNKSGRTVPHIAIVDWDVVPTYTEFELFKEYFDHHRVPTTIVDPRQIEYSNGRLRYKDFEIDLIYKRVVTNEFIEKFDEVKPIFQAYKDGNVCIINSFRVKYVQKKALFSILSDTENGKYFSKEEINAIKEHIPWTRNVYQGTTYYGGQKVDLIDFIVKNKDKLVLKPNDEYGGRGVKLGWEISQSDWENEIKSALNGFYIVQEKVEIPKETFPYYDNGLKFRDMIVDFDPYVFGPRVGGCLTRLSTSSLSNVSTGGGSVCTFIIEEK
jgi:hypothetical protein